ncbi:hypothetical protein CRE_16037 [Caenorhabditis remanei]|uniref:Uncharacterized protein n=1 Tax=Caenorhabditis remanei TaxID=31234 RepID=E3MBH2_CAERE|nr:hypothetical protein CRE_16037 [Caenorhabditis remanei]
MFLTCPLSSVSAFLIFLPAMFTLVIEGIRVRNDSTIYEHYLATCLQAYGTIMFLINNFLFICLILYKFRKKSDENDQNFHEPIFNQLFYNSAVFLVATDSSFLFLCFGKLYDNGRHLSNIMEFCIYTEAFLAYMGSILFAIIGMFSFLAAIQRITIFYLPKYKFLVTGILLKYEILLVYLSVIHYSYVVFSCLFIIQEGGQCSYQALYIYSFMIFIISIISAAVYIHIYRLFSKLESMDRGTYLLYQFTPIHSLLMVRFFSEKFRYFLVFSLSNYFQLHSVAHLAGMLLEDRFKVDVHMFIKLPSYFVFVLNIPGVLSLSYIVSQRSFRNIFSRIAYPIWREISS